MRSCGLEGYQTRSLSPTLLSRLQILDMTKSCEYQASLTACNTWQWAEQPPGKAVRPLCVMAEVGTWDQSYIGTDGIFNPKALYANNFELV